MGAINKRGIWVPAAGDGLLEAWETMAAKIGAYMPVASPAAAREALDAAQAAGMGATASNPILFLIGSGVQKIAYVADGTKTSSKWNLAPLNEVQVADDTYSTPSWSGYKDFTIAAGATSGMMSSSLPVAPYDRRVMVECAVYGNAKSGAPNIRLKLHDGKLFYGRFGSDPNTIPAQGSCVIPANEAPSISVALHGGGSTASVVALSGNENQSSLMVTAFPISMGV